MYTGGFKVAVPLALFLPFLAFKHPGTWYVGLAVPQSLLKTSKISCALIIICRMRGGGSQEYWIGLGWVGEICTGISENYSADNQLNKSCSRAKFLSVASKQWRFCAIIMVYKVGRKKTTLPGLEPGIPWFVVRCLIHWATGPHTSLLSVCRNVT